jgi:energy-coupling factor transporter ATP-binding protein EcfA2
MPQNSWWRAAVLASVVAMHALAQGGGEVPNFAIMAVVPQQANAGDEVVVWVSNDLPAGTDLAVTVGGHKAAIKLVWGKAITVVLPKTLVSGAAKVVVFYRGRASENSPEIGVLPAKTENLFENRQFLVLMVMISALVGGALTIFALRFYRGASAADKALHHSDAPLEENLFVALADIEAPKPPEGLVRACAAGGCVLFAGQGIDLISGYPQLGDILTNFVQRTVLEIATRQNLLEGLKRREVDAVIDILLASPAAAELAESVANAYRRSAPRRGVLDALRSIDFSAVVTTSWTPSLGQLFRSRNPLEIPLPRTDNVSDLLQSDRFRLIRLLGNAIDVKTLILTRTEMRQLIRRNDFFAKYLTSLLSTRTHVFIGVSASTIDEYFSALQWGPSTMGHFAVLQGERGSALQREQLRARYGIEIIETPSSAGLDGSRRFVEDLVHAVTAEKPSVTQRRAPDVPMLSRLLLENIGPFETLDLALSPGWNVILGNNGSGKSTILRAIAAALCGDDPRAAVVADRLLRAGASTGFVELTIRSDVYRAEFIRELSRVRVVNRQLTPLQTGKIFALGFPAVRGIVPPKGMSSDTSSESVPNPDVSDVLPLIAGEVDPRTESLKQWLMDLENRIQRDKKESGRLVDLRNRFFDLLNVFTPGLPVMFDKVDFDAKQVLVRTEDSDVPIPIDYLSQGMISVIGWVGTLLQRMYAVRAKSANPTQEPAVVLIDEIDAHLHPEWQQEIIGRLKAEFPQVQFIATTHSPLVVAGLRREDVFVAARDETTKRASVIPSPIHFEGLRADQILTSPLFGLSSTRQLHVDRHAELLSKRQRTPEEEQELTVLSSAIAETDEFLKTKRLRHALDQLASEEGFAALLSGQKLDPKMRNRILSTISSEEKKR